MPGLLAIIVAYLLGAIPFGFLLVKLARGADVRESGSGNIGATNVLRTTGRAAAVATLALDIAKGFAAVWLAAELTGRAPEWTSLAALAVMAGGDARAAVENVMSSPSDSAATIVRILYISSTPRSISARLSEACGCALG